MSDEINCNVSVFGCCILSIASLLHATPTINTTKINKFSLDILFNYKSTSVAILDPYRLFSRKRQVPDHFYVLFYYLATE